VNRFWTHLPLRVKAAALLLISIPVLLMASAALYRANLEERQARNAIQRVWDVRSLVQDSLVLISNAEASVRENVLRPDGALLEPYLRSQELLPQLVSHLNSLLEGNAVEIERWREVESMMSQDLELLGALTRLRAHDPGADTHRLLDEAAAISHNLRSKVVTIQMDQERVLRSNSLRAENARFRLFAILVESAAIALFFGAFAVLMLAGAITGQIRALDHNVRSFCQGLPERPVPVDNRETRNLREGLQRAASLLAEHEQQLRESELRFRRLYKEAPIAYHEIDQSGIIRHVNQTECALLGLERNDLIGKYVWDTVAPENRDKVRRFVLDRLSELQPATPYECEYECSDHTMIMVEVHENLIKNEQGQVSGIRSAMLDVSARKMVDMARRKVEQYARELRTKNEQLMLALNAAREACATKGRFLAAMSHELRTPLNGIIGLSELMYDGVVGPVSQEHTEYLGDILASSRHLLQLVNDVLDIAKVEAGKMEFRPETVDIAPVLHEVRDVLRILADKKKISIHVEAGAGVTRVVTDAARLKQVVYNYLSNAIKFTPDGGSIQMRALAESAGLFRIEVQDTGPGIREADIPRLFADFQQLERARPAQGSGLGLALTKRIVEGQGGSVGVNSHVGSGSTFYAILPTGPAASSESGDRLRLEADTGSVAAALSRVPELVIPAGAHRSD